MDDARINQVIQRVMSELGQGDRVRHGTTPAPVDTSKKPSPPPPIENSSNFFGDVDSAVKASRLAYEQLNTMPLGIREKMIASIRRTARENAQVMAYEAWQETGMGRYEDKVQKNLLNANKAPGTEMLTSTAWTGDNGMTLVEYAPWGVIGSIIPSTNPTSTVLCNTISMVAAGNSVIFNAHPGAINCSKRAVSLMNQAIIEAGGPPNLVTTISSPTIQTARDLMSHPGINLLVVTGGEAVVAAAMKSGKRVIGAGPGNPPIVVDETADIDEAGRDIVRGASFDNNIICIDEKELFVVDSVADALKSAMLRNGAYEIGSWQLKRLMKSIFAEPPKPGEHGVMNKKFIGKNANVLLKEIGINVGDEVRLVIAEVDKDHPLVYTEQLMPILPMVRVKNADEGIDLSLKAEHGFRHTAMMYSKNLDNLSRMAREMDCSIFVKNAPSYAGVGYHGEGFCAFTIASPTGDGITNPVSFSRIRRCIVKDSFRIV